MTTTPAHANRISTTSIHGIFLAMLLAGAGCSPVGLRLDDDLCDGTDSDGDGTIDEGSGVEIGCEAGEVCTAGLCSFDCGNGECTARMGENCSNCAEDCGPCPSCGDGTCNGAETCTTCVDDCGTCPVCGDGACAPSESCATCRDDCGLCPLECTTCTDDGDCGSGQRCGQRVCDGALGCYGTSASATCEMISGESCPAVPAYGRCTADAECGPRMRCSGGHCVLHSNHGCDECPPIPTGFPGLSLDCVNLTESPCGSPCVSDYFCHLACTSTCPYGMTCNSFGGCE